MFLGYRLRLTGVIILAPCISPTFIVLFFHCGFYLYLKLYNIYLFANHLALYFEEKRYINIYYYHNNKSSVTLLLFEHFRSDKRLFASEKKLLRYKMFYSVWGNVLPFIIYWSLEWLAVFCDDIINMYQISWTFVY